MQTINLDTSKPKHIAILIGVILGFNLLIISLASVYFSTHKWNWRSPIILRSPVTIEKLGDEPTIEEVSEESGQLEEEDEEVEEPEEEISYQPSKNTQILIEKNPKTVEKIKQVFEDEWLLASELIARESSFNQFAINPTSGACGLSQSLPCEKMKCELADVDCQLKWIKNYVQERYGNLENTLAFHDVKGYY